MSDRQKLFNYMADEHKVTLLENEMQTIENICRPQAKKFSDEKPTERGYYLTLKNGGKWSISFLEKNKDDVFFITDNGNTSTMGSIVDYWSDIILPSLPKDQP